MYPNRRPWDTRQIIMFYRWMDVKSTRYNDQMLANLVSHRHFEGILTLKEKRLSSKLRASFFELCSQWKLARSRVETVSHLLRAIRCIGLGAMTNFRFRPLMSRPTLFLLQVIFVSWVFDVINTLNPLPPSDAVRQQKEIFLRIFSVQYCLN